VTCIYLVKLLRSNCSTKGIMKPKASHEFVRRRFNGIIESNKIYLLITSHLKSCKIFNPSRALATGFHVEALVPFHSVKLSLHCPGSKFNSPQSPAELKKKLQGKRRPSSLLKQPRKALMIVHLPKYPRQESILLFIREIPHI
jgi:hypothetical protein